MTREVAARITETFSVREIGAVPLKGFEGTVVLSEVLDPESAAASSMGWAAMPAAASSGVAPKLFQ